MNYRKGLLTQRELAKRLGITDQHLNYLQRVGHIAAPTHRANLVQSRLYYTEKEVSKIVSNLKGE